MESGGVSLPFKGNLAVLRGASEMSLYRVKGGGLHWLVSFLYAENGRLAHKGQTAQDLQDPLRNLGAWPVSGSTCLVGVWRGALEDGDIHSPITFYQTSRVKGLRPDGCILF